MRRSTKIVATLGPASRSPETLGRLIEAGIDVARINFSHGKAEEHAATIQLVRELSVQLDRKVAILQDLQGPKIRVGSFAEGKVELEPGQMFDLMAEEVAGDQHRVSVSYRRLPADVHEGQILLLDDGRVRLRVLESSDTVIQTVVEVGGPLSNQKGVNIPGADLSIPSLTDKDLDDLILGTEVGVDWVAMSFVRRREDLLIARDHLRRAGSSARLMAKIEKPGAVDRFPEILGEADGIMVARGDLGVELPPEEVPVIQKRVLEQTREAGKPAITATQMLESMISNPAPTRAEASDVANAIYDGTDAIMLSAETAVGRYPVESVQMMVRIARTVEAAPEFQRMAKRQRMLPRNTIQDTIALAACEVAKFCPAAAIIVYTSSGSSAWRLSRNRPPVPVLALTTKPPVCNALALAYGITPALAPDPTDTDDMVRLAIGRAQRHGLADAGDTIVITAGVPFGVSGTTNMVRVEVIPGGEESESD